MFLFFLLVAIFDLAAPTHALDNGMGLTPPLGWSSWCSDGPCSNDRCYESEVKSVAEAMISNGMYALGYQWIILDDCWAAGKRTPSGQITWDTTRFPNGIPSLVDWMHKKGFKFGLYTSAGNQTCSSGGRPYPIPGSEGHYQADANTFASWSLDYVKIDWCGDVHKMFLDGILVGAKYYKAFSDALTHSTPKRPMYLEGVAAYLFLLGNVGTYYNTWRASSDHHDNWKNTKEVVATAEFLGKPGKPGSWSYMDVLMTGGAGCGGSAMNTSAHCPGMTDAEYLTEFTVWSILQSPLVVATDVRNMTSIMRRILLNKRILSYHNDTRTPPGVYAGGDSTCGEQGADTCQFFTRELHDGSFLVALVNFGEKPYEVKFPFNKLGWGVGEPPVRVNDLWTNTTEVAYNSYSVVLAPHASVYLNMNLYE